MYKLKTGVRIFCDLETSGLSPMSHSVLVASFILLKENEVIRKTFYGRPESVEKWDEGAEKIHKISLWDAMRFPTHTQMASEMLEFLQPCDEFWFHGLRKFDWIRLEGLFFKTGQVFDFRKKCPIYTVRSTIELAKQKLQLENYKLNTVSNRLGIDLDHHSAESDVNACYEIWRQLYEPISTNYTEINFSRARLGDQKEANELCILRYSSNTSRKFA